MSAALCVVAVVAAGTWQPCLGRGGLPAAHSCPTRTWPRSARCRRRRVGLHHPHQVLQHGQAHLVLWGVWRRACVACRGRSGCARALRRCVRSGNVRGALSSWTRRCACGARLPGLLAPHTCRASLRYSCTSTSAEAAAASKLVVVAPLPAVDWPCVCVLCYVRVSASAQDALHARQCLWHPPPPKKQRSLARLTPAVGATKRLSSSPSRALAASWRTWPSASALPAPCLHALTHAHAHTHTCAHAHAHVHAQQMI
jgi:hypothetical protein